MFGVKVGFLMENKKGAACGAAALVFLPAALESFIGMATPPMVGNIIVAAFLGVAGFMAGGDLKEEGANKLPLRLVGALTAAMPALLLDLTNFDVLTSAATGAVLGAARIKFPKTNPA